MLGYTEVYWDVLGYTEVYWDVLGYTEVYWDVLGYTEVYWDILKYTGMCWDILKYTTTGFLDWVHTSTYLHLHVHMQEVRCNDNAEQISCELVPSPSRKEDGVRDSCHQVLYC